MAPKISEFQILKCFRSFDNSCSDEITLWHKTRVSRDFPSRIYLEKLSALQVAIVEMAPSNQELAKEDTNHSMRVRMSTIKTPKTKATKAPSIESKNSKSPKKLKSPTAPKKLKSPKATKKLKKYYNSNPTSAPSQPPSNTPQPKRRRRVG